MRTVEPLRQHVVNGDCSALLPAIPDLSVDSVVTDPPWNRGRPYGKHDDHLPADHYIRWLNGILGGCARVSRGPVVCFLGNHNVPHLSALLAGTGLVPLQQLAWHREAGCPEAVLVAGRPGTRLDGSALSAARRRLATCGEPAERWGHPCPKPVRAVASLVRLVTPAGGTVLDPFVGTGSTLVAARVVGCHGIGIELNRDFCVTAMRRITTWPPPRPE